MGGPTPTPDNTKKTLYDRLGGDEAIKLVTDAFFDEVVEHDKLNAFFDGVSTSALKSHHVKFFRIVFGNQDNKPPDKDVTDFMMRTHIRLFREMGLDETDFDLFCSCFIQGLKIVQVDHALIDECVVLIAPFRAVFEYGGNVAKKEKTMTKEELQTLPNTSYETFGTDEPVVLPEYSKIEEPQWLSETLKKQSNTGNVRDWTSDMTDKFGPQGDVKIADTFLDQPYMDHHVYLVAFLHLAFFPEDVDKSRRAEILDIVKFPRGHKHAPLSRELFDRMIIQFRLTCHMMGMSNFAVSEAEKKLLTYREKFSLKTKKVGGADAPHILLKNHKRKTKQKAKKDKKDSTSVTSMNLLGFDDDEESVCSLSSGVTANSLSSNVSGTSSKGKPKEKSGGFHVGHWSVFRKLMGTKKAHKVPSTAA